MATIVCVVGDKGGTGKSTWARGLADLYRLTGAQAALFDGDWLARSLFKFHRTADSQGRPQPLERQDPRRGCILYDARDRRFGRDLLLNSMGLSHAEVILHDLPAGFRTDVTQVMGAATPAEAVREFVASVNAMGHRAVLVNVMTPSPSDHHTAPWLAETVKNAATVIAVRNGMFDPTAYGVWRREAGRAFAAAGGIEIEMPRLDTDAAVLIDQRAARFTAAVADERMALADRMRVLSWLRRFAESLVPVAESLRLPADIAARVAALRIDGADDPEPPSSAEPPHAEPGFEPSLLDRAPPPASRPSAPRPTDPRSTGPKPTLAESAAAPIAAGPSPGDVSDLDVDPLSETLSNIIALTTRTAAANDPAPSPARALPAAEPEAPAGQTSPRRHPLSALLGRKKETKRKDAGAPPLPDGVKPVP